MGGAKLHNTNMLTAKCQKSIWLNALVNNLIEGPTHKEEMLDKQ